VIATTELASTQKYRQENLFDFNLSSISIQFEEGIEMTERWYLNNQEWMDNVTSGNYERYYEEMYKKR